MGLFERIKNWLFPKHEIPEDLGTCLECDHAHATRDLNGHEYWVCDDCFEKLKNEYDISQMDG